MGLGMATNLQKHLVATKGKGLIFSNRTRSRGVPLQELGAEEETSFEKLVSKCGIIFTMVRAYADSAEQCTDLLTARH